MLKLLNSCILCINIGYYVIVTVLDAVKHLKVYDFLRNIYHAERFDNSK